MSESRRRKGRRNLLSPVPSLFTRIRVLGMAENCISSSWPYNWTSGWRRTLKAQFSIDIARNWHPVAYWGVCGTYWVRFGHQRSCFRFSISSRLFQAKETAVESSGNSIHWPNTLNWLDWNFTPCAKGSIIMAWKLLIYIFFTIFSSHYMYTNIL